MLEKKNLVRKIHLLRIIGFLEADFNTALKFFFAKQMMESAEATGLTDEQLGLRKNRTLIDTAMVKLLTFECARAKKSTIGENSYDCNACFNRIKRPQPNIMAQKHNVDENVLLCWDLCIEHIK